MPSLNQKLKENRSLILIAGLALLLKLIYLFFIGPVIFSTQFLVDNDTDSYTKSFINLIKTGTYTHTPGYEPASYGRLPGVSFIWGLFYLLGGYENAFKLVAIFQILLDCIATLFIYKIVMKFFSRRAAFATIIVYSLFPFTWYYITKTGIEYPGLFICIAVIYQLVFFRPNAKHTILLSLTLVAGFLIRETLLLLTLLSLLYLQRHYAFSFKNLALGIFIFLLIYLPWPLRNYFNHHVFMPVKELSAGYTSYNKDMLSFMYWMYAWHNSDIMNDFNASFKDGAPMNFPDEIFGSEKEKELADKLILLSRHCGTSFIEWKKMTGQPIPKAVCDRNELIAGGFDVLRRNYISAHPFRYYFAVPMLNAKKVFFKSSLTADDAKISSCYKLVMMCRTIILLTGIIACFIFYKQDFFKLLLFFFAAHLLFVCFILRQVEMRYFFQADVLMLMAACCLLFGKIFRKLDASSIQ